MYTVITNGPLVFVLDFSENKVGKLSEFVLLFLPKAIQEASHGKNVAVSKRRVPLDGESQVSLVQVPWGSEVYSPPQNFLDI